MWTVLRYHLDSVDQQVTPSVQPVDKSVEDILLQDTAKTIEDQIKNYTDNYMISLHYLDFPVVFCYGSKTVPNSKNLSKLVDYIEPYKELVKIVYSGAADIIHGFVFVQKHLEVRKALLDSKDQETFDHLASISGLEPYILNDIRTIWKNKRYEYLSSALPKRIETLYRPNEEHPLYKTVVGYIEDIYRRGVDRFKTFICVGSTYIGKSVFFTKFLVPEQYFVYHSNFLEYSKMADQPKKIFRILDDIHWEQVSSTELKALLNRNISSVNIKYGYEYIFPLIPIIIMNGEDYKLFKSHFSDIWEFIERNAVIYPPQYNGNEEECVSLFTNEISTNIDDDYIFNNILDVKELEKFEGPNLNEWIKNELIKTCGWKYNTVRYIQLPERPVLHIPNFELSKKSILKDYEAYLLRKKQKEMADEKKPKPPGSNRWAGIFSARKSYKKAFKGDDMKSMDKYDDDITEDNDDDGDDDMVDLNDEDDQKTEMSSESGDDSDLDTDEDDFVEL